ncbi:MAG: hypothetical protein RDU14_16985 [Melioribacteraceae bacterium]|nr:hypothetical protein [Melioribacteraceae bacterium]
MSLENKLQKMKGKTFMYKQLTRKIIDFKITEDEVFISTDANIIVLKHEKAESELDLFLPAEGQAPSGLVKFGEDPNWNKLKETAYDLINKLNGNEGQKYIEIANATNQTIHSVVDIMKTEIEAVKLFKDR